MKEGDSIFYRRHGSFRVCCIKGGHAHILHSTIYGRLMNLVVPERQWLHVSNGSYQVSDLNYESYLQVFAHLAQPERVQHSPGAFDKFHQLFDGFRGYWQENFSPECQEDQDSSSFTLGARIRYAMTCIMEGQPIPPDCDYQKLVKEVDDWISYREGKFN